MLLLIPPRILYQKLLNQNEINIKFYIKMLSRQTFSLLNKSNFIAGSNANNILIIGMPDFHPLNGPIFLNCNKLILHQCDKNFVYYWLRKYYFPKLEYVYCNSHPCGPAVLNRMKHENINLVLSKHYSSFKNKWACNNSNITIVDDKMDNLYNSIMYSKK